MKKKTIISGVGCCLVDLLYTDINFSDKSFKDYLSRKSGDGGLVPGHLVFVEEFEQFSGRTLSENLLKITNGKPPDAINVGGPSIVALINATQILDPDQFEVRFYGKAGNDENGNYLTEQLKRTAVNLENFNVIDLPTPNTIVLSDPNYDHGTGERLFINSIGAAWEVLPGDLENGFFNSDYVVFGATALSPNIHDNLYNLLLKAKEEQCTTIVNTVFDFRNEKRNPREKWPLGSSDESYRYIDLLIMDKVEAFRLRGTENIERAIDFFIKSGCSSFIITDGSRDILAYSNGKIFNKIGIIQLPVSSEVSKNLQVITQGDTTGCGDNFAGGVIASLVKQSANHKPDLVEACSWGVVSGGFSCYYVGGTFNEKHPGEKLSKLKPLYESYRGQISHQ